MSASGGSGWVGPLVAVALLAACDGKPEPARPAAASATRSESIDDVAQKVAQALNAHDADALRALYAPNMLHAMSLEHDRAFVDRVAAAGRLGALKAISIFDTHAVYEVYAGTLRATLTLDLDANRKITGLLLVPAKAEPPVQRTKLPLGLPFRGEWLVFWGGSTPDVNPHVKVPADRRAADLDKVDATGRDHSGDGTRNADFFSYGAEVLAVADGVVALVVDGVPENEPGQMNPTHLGGNEILIAHDGGEHSLYAHLQPGKHRVKQGDRVKRGDVIAIAGNSGNSSQPHLHFQLQDGPDPTRSWGIDAVFNDVQITRDGHSYRATGYTFAKGDRVAGP